MKQLLVLLLLIICVQLWAQKEYASLTFAQTQEHLGLDDFVKVDGATYKVLESQTPDNVTIFQVGTKNKYLVLQTLEDVAKSAGLVADAVEFTFDITGNTVTTSSAVFTADDVGKDIACVRCNSKVAAIEGLAGYQGNVANYASLPGSPTDGHIYRVDDNSDAPGESAVSEVRYWLYDQVNVTGARWQEVRGLDNDVWTITGFTSTTIVTVDYTAPTALTTVEGVVGTNNRDNWSNLLDYAVANEVTDIALDGRYLMTYDLVTSYSKTSTLPFCDITIRGTGKNTVLYYKHETDPFTDLDLTTSIASGPLESLIHIVQTGQPVTNTFNLTVKNLVIEGHKERPFRIDGARRDHCIALVGANGNIDDVLLEGVTFQNANDLTYFSDGNVRAVRCTWNGYNESEAGIQVFGSSSFEATDIIIRGIGASLERCELDLKNPSGRALYANPTLNIIVRNSRIIDINGLVQHFSSGGSDELYDEPTVTKYENCLFGWEDRDNQRFEGVLTGRIQNTIIERCRFVNTGNNTTFAALLNTNVLFDHCEFNGATVVGSRTNTGTNNIWYSEEQFFDFTNCDFINSSIDFYATWNTQPANRYRLIDCYWYNDGSVFNDVFRLLPADVGQVRSKIEFIRNRFYGDWGTGTEQSSGWLFVEHVSNTFDVDIDVEFVGCEFYSDIASTGINTLTRNLGGGATLTLTNCVSPQIMGVFSGGNTNDLVFGSGNDFPAGFDGIALAPTTHKFQLNTDLVYPTTLTAAATVTITDWNEGAFNITGTVTAIDRFLIPAGVFEERMLYGRVVVNNVSTTDNLVFNAGTNISTAVTAQPGGNIIFEYDPTTLMFTPVGGYLLL